MPDISFDEARHAKDKALEMLRGFPLAGIGITGSPGAYRVKVNLTRGGMERAIPAQIDRVPLVVEVIGQVMKRAA